MNGKIKPAENKNTKNILNLLDFTYLSSWIIAENVPHNKHTKIYKNKKRRICS